MSPELETLNALPSEEARALFSSCCASSEWARRMSAARPFESFRELADEADRISRSLSREDWLEAFAGHPKIGSSENEKGTDLFYRSHPKIGDSDSEYGGGCRSAGPVPATFSSRAWSREEQGGTKGASPETLANLADANREYEERFGYIFIVCASGRSAAEMLALAEKRLGNDPATELAIAVEEQRKITRLRLEKLLATER
ncbi:MAG TPA: 2-oxo-4-hydroxy-4-carboxy-5-ureidoimidazoline decarboxylase [Thermoanaerobaculia bacterium]